MEYTFKEILEKLKPEVEKLVKENQYTYEFMEVPLKELTVKKLNDLGEKGWKIVGDSTQWMREGNETYLLQRVKNKLDKMQIQLTLEEEEALPDNTSEKPKDPLDDEAKETIDDLPLGKEELDDEEDEEDEEDILEDDDDEDDDEDDDDDDEDDL